MTAAEAFAAFLDRCCGRYARNPSYRRTLAKELPRG